MDKSRLVLVITVVLLSMALVSGALAAASRTAEGLALPTTEQDSSSLPESDGPWVVHAYYKDQQMVADVAARIEPWEVNVEQGYIVLEVDREQYLWLLWLGFRVEVDEKLTTQLLQPRVRLPGQVSGIPGYPCYRTVEETFTSAAQIVADHPNLAAWIDIGDSWEKVTPGGLPGYDLMVLRLTNAAIPGPKPKLFAMTAIHAREYATAELNTRFAEHLASSYGVDPDVTWLLDHHEIHLLLVSNPDGRKMAETGISWRKNTDNNYCSNTNSRGADLNRNFNFQWNCCGGGSNIQCDETYRGPSAASEPETQAVQNYVIAEFPDQRPDDLTTPAPLDATGLFMDIHSYGRLVLWPWGFSTTPPPNAAELQTLGRKFAFFNDYDPAHHIWYDVDGATDDFAYGRLGLSSYVFEIGTSFFQDCASFENTILPDNLPALLYAAKSARHPYMTPAGPEALNVVASPAAVPAGAPVTLNANLDDTRFNNQNGNEPTQSIAGAEYYIDVPPWSTSPAPVAHAMTASDGAFNSTSEDVQAVINTASLGVGRHIVFVRGRDTSGNWGPVSAAFLYIIDPDVSPMIEGYVRDFETNAPLGASISAGAFSTTSDPTSGYYSMTVINGTYDMSAQAPGYTVSSTINIVAPDNSLVQQNFLLQPICTIFQDDVESGNLGWTVQPPWAITNEAAHSPVHSWTDSPGAPYDNERYISITSPIFDLSNITGVTLSFWHIYDIEPGWDYGYVEYSTNGGSTWGVAASYSQYQQLVWSQEILPVPQLDGQASARIRFRFFSDQSIQALGWHIDDIHLYGSGPACITPIAPSADFSNSSPALASQPVRFTDLTQGTHPLNYSWDFGDGLGTSTLSDPYYTYPASGTYTVTLTVTNSLDSDTVSHPVVVEQCTPVSAVTLTLQTTGTLLLGAPIDFQADVGPDEAHKPYQYSIDYGDGNIDSGSTSADPLNLQHIYLLNGPFPVQFSAWNCGMPVPQTDTIYVDIYAEAGIQITPTVSSLTALPGEYVTYTLLVTNTGPLINSYNIQLSGNSWQSGAAPTALGPLNPGQAQEFYVSVLIPLDAEGGAADSVTATIYSQTPGIIPVSSVLTTHAENVHGLQLLPAISEGQGLPGAIVTHTLLLTNTGNITDSFALQVDGTWAVAISVVPQSAYQGGIVTLARGRSAVISAAVSIPAGSAAGASEDAALSVNSTGNPSISAQATLRTAVVIHHVHLPLIPAQ